MKMIDKGVLIIMSHLIITILIIIGYMFSSYHGHSDETLKGLLFTAFGYWFGAIGKVPSKVKALKQGGTKDNE